jgi:hypothetical protein
MHLRHEGWRTVSWGTNLASSPVSGVCAGGVQGSGFGWQSSDTDTLGGAVVDPRHGPPSGSQRDDQDFVDRFRQGPGAISDEEAASRYEQVAPNLPPDVYQRSAQEVFAQLTPYQRMQLGQTLVQSARQQGQSFPDVNQDCIDDRMQDPDYLAQTATRIQHEQPGC